MTNEYSPGGYQPGGGSQEPLITPTKRAPGGPNVKYMMMAGAGLAIVLFAGFVWYLYDASGDGDLPPPIIRAEEGPTKIKPEDPGGLEIPHRDKLVYSRLDPSGGGRDDEEVTETLLPMPGAPALPPVGAGQAASAPALPGSAADGLLPEDDLLPDDDLLADDGLLADDETGASADDLLPLPEVEAVSADNAAYLVQLFAVRSESRALAGWERLRAKHEALLGGLNPYVQRADLGERGVFFRLRVGPFGARAAATDVCDRLKARGQNCVVIKP